MPDFNSLFGKAKAKAESLAKQHNLPFPGQPSQNQYQAHPNNQYPPNAYHQPPQGQFPGNAYPPPNNYQQQGYYPPQNQYPPPNQYPQQGQYGQAPFQQPQSFTPPLPPQSTRPGAPPIPGNKPGSYPAPQIGGTYWQPSFSPSIPVSENFKHQTGAHGWGNNELQNYIPDPANSFHTPDNKLVVRAVSKGGQYTSARLTSHKTLGRQKGSLIAVATPPCAAGIWPALWLLPNEPFQWPNEAEIDILETWNADNVNHSCLHWGQFNGEDWNKHRVVDTPIPDMPSGRPIRYEFAWHQEEFVERNTGGGRAVWYIDGRPVMKAQIPPGARRMDDWQIIINVAMGGNVCQGKTPAEGYYDFVIHELKLNDEPAGGWERFAADFEHGPEGHH